MHCENKRKVAYLIHLDLRAIFNSSDQSRSIVSLCYVTTFDGWKKPLFFSFFIRNYFRDSFSNSFKDYCSYFSRDSSGNLPWISSKKFSMSNGCSKWFPPKYTSGFCSLVFTLTPIVKLASFCWDTYLQKVS